MQARIGDAVTAERMIARLLNGKVLTSVNYGPGFSVEFAGDSGSLDLPAVVRLTFQSRFTFEGNASWRTVLESNPLPRLDGEPDEPSIALTLVRLSGERVVNTELVNGCDLQIAFGIGKMLIAGHDPVWEESWIIDVPPGVKNQGKPSITCMADGTLFILDAEQRAE